MRETRETAPVRQETNRYAVHIIRFDFARRVVQAKGADVIKERKLVHPCIPRTSPAPAW